MSLFIESNIKQSAILEQSIKIRLRQSMSPNSKDIYHINSDKISAFKSKDRREDANIPEPLTTYPRQWWR